PQRRRTFGDELRTQAARGARGEGGVVDGKGHGVLLSRGYFVQTQSDVLHMFYREKSPDRFPPGFCRGGFLITPPPIFLYTRVFQNAVRRGRKLNEFSIMAPPAELPPTITPGFCRGSAGAPKSRAIQKSA